MSAQTAAPATTTEVPANAQVDAISTGKTVYTGAQPAAPVAGHEGFLYEVAVPEGVDPAIPAGARLILFGTIHVDRVGARVLTATGERELVAAQRLALEADPRDSATVARVVRQYGYYASGDGLSRHVGARDLAALHSLETRFGEPVGDIERLKPWFVANNLATFELLRIGLTPQAGSEGTLARVAGEHAIPVVEIEGFDQQLGMFDGQSEELQRAQLREAIDEIQTGELDDEARQLVSAWHAGDARALTALLASMGEQDQPYARFTIEHIIIERDHSMAERATQFLRQGGTTFFAVGCLHLFGDDGLIALMKKRGYWVRELP